MLEAFHMKLLVYKVIMIPTQEIALHRLRKIMKNSSPPEEKDTGKKVMFISIDARHMPHTYLEGGIALRILPKSCSCQLLDEMYDI